MAKENKDLQVNEEQIIKEKIKAVLEARELDPEQQAKLEESEARKRATLEKIKAVVEAKEDELEKAAEEIAPDFDYEAAAEEIEVEEAAAEIKLLYGIELFRANYEAERLAKPLPPEYVIPSKYPRPKYQAKTKLGQFFLKDIHRMTMLAWIILFTLTVMVEVVAYAIPETVNITYMSLNNVKKEAVETRARTVGDFRAELIAKGYEISENDAMLPTEDTPIKDGMSVQIMKATEAKARIAGRDKTIFLIPGTVKETLDFNSITYDDDDEISPALDTEVTSKTKIVVDEVHYKTKDKKEKVEATNKVILDPSLTSGVEERTEGNDGEGIFTYKTKYVNGKKIKTDKDVKEWITEPHDNTLHLGTSVTGKSGEYVVVRTFIANCTAYTARPGAGGALGEGVHRGTCAVDPSFVPYRSQMWIEGYGDAYANDCGGAVKGNVVDLFMNSTGECIQWGRRNMTAYILEPVN